MDDYFIIIHLTQLEYLQNKVASAQEKLVSIVKGNLSHPFSHGSQEGTCIFKVIGGRE